MSEAPERPEVTPGRRRAGQVVVAVILGLVAMAVVTQLRLRAADDEYAGARREDLIQILDGLHAESRRLEGEIDELEQTRQELATGADSDEVARIETERRLQELRVLAGTAPATGPGIRMVVRDPQGKVSESLMVDAVQELRDAGAEVIEINDTVRVVADTWFGPGPDGAVVADGVPLARPVTIEAIGDPHALEEGVRFRGGLVSEISGPRVGGSVDVSQVAELQVDSLHPAEPYQYARPAR